MLDQLPPALAERVRVLAERAPVPGRYVLYWMHHALRADENPALDVARHLACTAGVPLLVAQGLGGAHRYNSDRHHFFLLQSARDVARDLGAMGIAFRFHLDPDIHGSVPDLARDAAAVVVEEMPVPPFPAWQRTLAGRTEAPVFAVDARCIVPMRLVRKRHDRAFAFRKAVKDDYEARLLSTYPEIDAEPPAPGDDLAAGAFEVAGRSDAELLEAIARCPIDHSIGPVWHTPGGSDAARERWDAFKARGLATYHRLRNDAAVEPPKGVSRLSPYLHYGCISPFRVAREAALEGGGGAEKFLDELFVWRELSHNFCFHTPDPESFDALPEWARDTLRDHAGDARPEVFSWDTLAHARTGEPLWDLAQRSLLTHGELHNNLRMTWAKQLLQWTSSPDKAMAMLIDLNHRYALDGNDPNSYGGLLWALGLFDRPFKPPVEVLGTVRPRSIEAHAKRLDMDAYAQRVRRPAGPALRVAVIGAGLAGTAAARTLADHGHEVRIFEKGRGPGGRMATRRGDGGTFDHGAQYFSTRNAAFARRVEAWCEDGLAAPWPRRLATIDKDGVRLRDDQDGRFVFVPGMDALGKHLADGLDLRTQARVEGLRRAADGWALEAEGGEGPFDRVIITAPLPQARDLLETCGLAASLDNVDTAMLPCLAAMLTLPATDADFDAAFVDDEAVAWVAEDSTKPGRRTADRQAHWVVHATEAFSNDHLDDDLDRIGEKLAAEFARVLPGLPAALGAVGHRWRFARVSGAPLDPDGDGARDLGAGLWLAGDACTGDSRVENAWASGVAAAARVMASTVA